MKNQYFGDINDYRKYGLLRSIMQATSFNLCIAWMLTPDDGGGDGNFLAYLTAPEKWSKYDPILFHKLIELVNLAGPREVRLFEQAELLPRTVYFTDPIPDPALDRNQWFDSLVKRSKESDFVFLDPDNGLEIQSKPYGRRYSSKYLYWHEVEKLWSIGKSLLIYQHFVRVKRSVFIEQKLEELRSATVGSTVEAFSTPNVVFVLALQPAHRRHYDALVASVESMWNGQIQTWNHS